MNVFIKMVVVPNNVLMNFQVIDVLVTLDLFLNTIILHAKSVCVIRENFSYIELNFI